MPKYCHPDVLDASLEYLAENADTLALCTELPADYAAAVAAAIATVAIDAGDFAGPAAGDVSGRKITVGAQSGLTIDVEGDPSHVCLLDTTGERLLYATEEGTVQTLLLGNTVDVPAWDIEIRDPT